MLAAEELVRRKRVEVPGAVLELEEVTCRLRLAVDRVSGEGGLWGPELAARAIRQATIGAVGVTEVEAIEDLDGGDEERTMFDVGYGLCFGHNEKKAIAMAS